MNSEELRELGHEMRNILVVISGSAQLSLMEEIENEAVKNHLKVIVQETRKISDMIEKLIAALKAKTDDKSAP
jgi:nitrogen-specific signal transduction histidine kinase